MLQIENKNLVTDRNGRQVVLSRNCILAIVDDTGRQRATHKAPYGTRLLVAEGGKVSKGLRLAEWDPYTLPIITEKSGIVKFADLIDGVSVRDLVDDATGITNKIVVDWRSAPKGADLKPGIALVDKSGAPVKLGAGDLDVRYLLSVDAILSVEDGDEVEAGDVLARIPRESAKTRDITGGLPRVAELFEARRPKDHAVLAEMDGIVKFGRDYKNKRRIIIESQDDPDTTSEYLIPKGKHITVQEGDYIRKGEFLLDGNPAPHDILSILGVEELANYLVQEIQEVYRLQGVPINDKHIEVIVRQMLQKVEITHPGETTLLKGEQIDRLEFDEINEKVQAEGRKPAEAVPVLLGITKASLQTRSFISAASFQETTRVLTEAAVAGKVDYLAGLKENVIVGRLIPAGTGALINEMKAIAARRDQEILAQQKDDKSAITSAGDQVRADAEAVFSKTAEE